MAWASWAGTLLSSYSASQSGGGGGGGGTDIERKFSSNRQASPFVFQPGGGNEGLSTWQWVTIGAVGLGGLWILTSGSR